MWRTRQVPVTVTIVNQDDVADLRSNAERYQVLKQAIVRAAFDAYAQDGLRPSFYWRLPCPSDCFFR